jgi:hypothetical protein
MWPFLLSIRNFPLCSQFKCWELPQFLFNQFFIFLLLVILISTFTYSYFRVLFLNFSLWKEPWWHYNPCGIHRGNMLLEYPCFTCCTLLPDFHHFCYNHSTFSDDALWESLYKGPNCQDKLKDWHVLDNLKDCIRIYLRVLFLEWILAV